jgi:hypothetical protein
MAARFAGSLHRGEAVAIASRRSRDSLRRGGGVAGLRHRHRRDGRSRQCSLNFTSLA